MSAAPRTNSRVTFDPRWKNGETSSATPGSISFTRSKGIERAGHHRGAETAADVPGVTVLHGCHRAKVQFHQTVRSPHVQDVCTGRANKINLGPVSSYEFADIGLFGTARKPSGKCRLVKPDTHPRGADRMGEILSPRNQQTTNLAISSSNLAPSKPRSDKQSLDRS